jgi:hypothetical protein
MNATILVASLLCGQVDYAKTADGSSFYGETAIKVLEVETAYGKLSIPWTDVKSVQFGVRPDAKTHAEIERLVKNLGSTLFKERDEATKTLMNIGPLALGQLLAVSKADAEASQRAIKIVSDIKQTHKDRQSFSEADVVETSEFTAKGKVLLDDFAFKTDSLGDIKVARQRLTWIYRNGGSAKAFVIEANGTWHDTGIKITEGSVMSVEAQGQVDLWPQGQGQYVSSPKGYTTAGKGTAFMAGALIAKIGNSEFTLGETYSSQMNLTGSLLLMISPSPWNNDSTGHYTVRIKLERR